MSGRIYLCRDSRKYKVLHCECPQCCGIMRVRLIEGGFTEYMICEDCGYLYNSHEDSQNICAPVA